MCFGKYRTIKKINCSGTIWFVMSDSSKIYIGTADGTFSLYDYEGNLISFEIKNVFNSILKT